MVERICPFMTRPKAPTVQDRGQGKHIMEAARIFCPQSEDCYLWDGDCGLKVRRDDRHKEMWEKMKKWCRDDKDYAWIRVYMDRIEAEMGGKNA